MSASSTVSSAAPATTAPRRRWGKTVLWLLLGLVVAAVVAVVFFLDPWLRRALERQVTKASNGRYELSIKELETSLWKRSATVRGVQLRTRAGAPADTAALPELRLDLGELRVSGVGLLAVLRRQVVPVDSVVADSAQVRLARLPATSGSGKPLYSRLPLGLPGLQLGFVALRRVRVRYGTLHRAKGQIEQATLQARDLLLSAAGAADTSRLGYARQVQVELGQVVARLPGHLMQLQRGTFSSESQQVLVGGLRLVPLQPVSAQRSPAARIDLDVSDARLLGLRAAALARGTLRADSLVLLGGRLAVTLPTVAPPPHKLLAAYLPRILVGGVRVAGAGVRVAGTKWAPAVHDIRLTGSGLHLSPQTYSAPGYLYYARAWTLQTGRAYAALNAPYYQLACEALRADTRRGLLALRMVRVAPTMTVAELARRKGHQTAHVTVRLPELNVQALDFAALLRQGNLQARQLELKGARIVTMSDGRFPVNPKNSIATPDAVGRLPFRVDVRQVRIQDAGIRMSYRSPRSAQAGVMGIQQFTGTLRNFSNDPRHMSAARPLTGEATGVLQKQSRARMVLRANLLDPNGRHTVQGSFTSTPLAALNPMVVPTRGIRFRSGQIQRIRFEMQLGRAQAQGTMWAEYRDLKLELLNKKNKPGVLHRIETSLANGIFLRDNNPRQPGQDLKTGQMASRRELRYSVFSLWRQGLVSGLLNSAGVPKPLAKKLSESE
ncbi:hypothetical protein KBK19_15580 [Microvirga sp. STR05]|uniref:DUF748 domain-containing protein n=1 Tax=Hymenobacter duratus TaxID=2771356 RepID=A0ABR8JM67_9BACT|nr:hypothetical protein [Hymenobacter duratus]MBD2716462.1 hypothetical protein [Hymenobacter duratus]MBR7951377.1 hypothetical protein [Microvirga sp. STR05]